MLILLDKFKTEYAFISYAYKNINKNMNNHKVAQ